MQLMAEKDRTDDQMQRDTDAGLFLWMQANATPEEWVQFTGELFLKF